MKSLYGKMASAITPQTESNLTRMTQKQLDDDGRTIILVEGMLDSRWLKTHIIQEDCCQVQQKNGLDNLKQAFKDASGSPNVIAIADQDYAPFCDTLYDLDNFFYYDTHSLETMIITSKAFNRFLSIQKDINADDCRNALLDTTYLLGLMRLINAKNSYNLSFSRLDFNKLFKTSTIEELEILNEIINKSQQHNLKEELQKNLEEEKQQSYDPYQICHGHDLVKAFIIQILKKKLINPKKNKLYTEEEEHQETLLCSVFTMEYFKQTQLYEALLTWQNPSKYKLWAEPI